MNTCIMHKINMASKLNLLAILAVKLLQTTVQNQAPPQNALAAGICDEDVQLGQNLTKELMIKCVAVYEWDEKLYSTVVVALLS